MAGSTSGGISDLAFVMNMRIDESSVTDAMRTLGDMKSKMSTSTFSAIDSGGSTSSQDIADTKFAEAQQYVAQLDASYEASEQQRLAAIQAQEDANEAAFAAAQQHVAQLDAAEEAAEQQRLAAVNAEIDAIEGDMTRALRRTLNIEDQINFDYQRRLEAIDAIQGATAQQTAELRLQAAAVRDAATQTAINAGQIGGIGGAGLTGNRIQEIGRGIEDFTVGFSMATTNIEGIAMGLRGSANNAAQLAASFNPVVGASVAIGASLATVIVPMVARWLYDTKELEKAQDAWNDKLKESGNLQQEVADNLARLEAINIKNASETEEKRGQALLAGMRQMEDRLIENDQSLRFKEFALLQAKDAEEDAKNQLRRARETAAINAAATIGGGVGLPGGVVSRPGTSSAEDEKAASDAKKVFELAESARQKAEKELSKAEGDVLKSEESIGQAKLRLAEKIAKAETDIFNAEMEKQEQRRDAMRENELEKARSSAWNKYRLEEERIKALRLSKEKQDDLVANEAELRDKSIADAEKKSAESNAKMFRELDNERQSELSQKIFAVNEKRREDIAKIEKGSLDELGKRRARDETNLNANQKINKIRELDRLDDALNANAEQQDALKEKINLAGNANTSSAAMSVGSQAAESAIAKALSGSASVESTDKKQLKVLEKIEKKIGKEKQRIASIT